MRILVWHVHGSWTTSFVQGGHTYLLPVEAGRGPDGRGRAETWDWPRRAVEVPLDRLGQTAFDLVLLQRPRDLELTESLTGLRPGHDVPALYLEHNTPAGAVPFTRHPMADDPSVPVVHVTAFNRLMWDCGAAPTHLVEHGILDPGRGYTGELPHAAVVVNDPLRRGRAVGADLIASLAQTVPVDVFGMRVAELGAVPGVTAYDDLPQHELHRELARRRVYVHLTRWTSLGLSLLEAMQLGMPVVALATTETASAVPADAGVLTLDPDELVQAVRRLLADPGTAYRMGHRAREGARRRYGLDRFLSRWDALLGQTHSAWHAAHDLAYP